MDTPREALRKTKTAAYVAPPELSGITTNVIPVGCKGSVRRTLPVVRRLFISHSPALHAAHGGPRCHDFLLVGRGALLPGQRPVENSRLQHWRAQIQSRAIPSGLKIKNYSFLFSQAGQLVILGN